MLKYVEDLKRGSNVEACPHLTASGIFDRRVGHQASLCGLCLDKKDYFEMAPYNILKIQIYSP
jgi:hypothetical protein